MPGPDEVLQQIEQLLAEQRQLLAAKLTEELVFEYKQRERHIRELFKAIADNHRQS
jgi:predicted dithiol-disulfide oxidoreductase (DUF899 family)